MEILKVKDYEEMSKKACSIMIEKMNSLERPVLGMATGSTPEGLYQQLIRAYQEEKVSFKQVSTFNLDEYVGIERENPNSYHYYMKDKLFGHIDLLPENAHLPNGNAADLDLECWEYENKIRNAGQIDLQVVGLGLNGHIGFNEPGTPFSSRTQVINLAESTRKANARFFASLNEVPTQAITMGIDTIMESKQILLLVSGKKKADPLARLLNGEVSEDFPASILHRHPSVLIIADEEACQYVTTQQGYFIES
ncbi:glucosamine-6-phosphate deaminase [Mesobacillus maritimus]|uniref:Glucosamine-6-phosphate deaminase n=1 Tax=Mesobacillus maritimus TaxID=1643336 RepID=A0ABS7K8D0_9BACI|nr:glucosamine-6-phosphate deaminase [Mesobacillus maritimus]MBY0098345.1 glucosamine-6-phosphate deaminase [Mesobacillus maritimus]